MGIDGNLKKILKERDINVLNLSKELKIEPSNLYRITRGENKNPTINTLIKIADYLDITLDELVGR